MYDDSLCFCNVYKILVNKYTVNISNDVSLGLVEANSVLTIARQVAGAHTYTHANIQTHTHTHTPTDLANFSSMHTSHPANWRMTSATRTQTHAHTQTHMQVSYNILN